MINPALHRDPVPLDIHQHRTLKVDFPVVDWSLAGRLNAIFVAATEFPDICREYPVVFVRAGTEADGRPQIAPIAVLGVAGEENLYVEGTQWRASYMPAVLQAYPFCIGRIDDKQFAVCVDMAWPGAGGAAGQRLFDDGGQPGLLLQNMQKHLELIESAIQGTRAFGQRLVELDLMTDMRFDATLPDGRKHSVDGFLTVDQAKATKLPDNVVGELHRSGMLGLIHLHWASLGLMRRLMDWHVVRHPAPAADSAAASTPSAPAR